MVRACLRKKKGMVVMRKERTNEEKERGGERGKEGGRKERERE